MYKIKQVPVFIIIIMIYADKHFPKILSIVLFIMYDLLH